MRDHSGKLIVITGPSGVGKGTLIQRVLAAIPELTLSTSATTRPMRPGETHGQDYIFCSRPQFESMIANNELLEWAEYAGNLYGTPHPPVHAALAQGSHILLEIEVQGALQVKDRFPDAVLVFIAPPSVEILQQRLTSRNTDSPEVIANRLAVAQKELAQAEAFEHVLVNDDLEQTTELLLKLLRSILSDLSDEAPSPLGL